MAAAKTFTYNKKEKLKSKKQLDKLFARSNEAGSLGAIGKSFIVFPIKVFYMLNEAQDNFIKTGVGVSSRHFKKAVQRNRVKRLLRETYRLEKQPLYNYLNGNKKQLALFLLFIDKELPQYILLREKMKLCVQRLIKELNETIIENT